MCPALTHWERSRTWPEYLGCPESTVELPLAEMLHAAEALQCLAW